MASGASYVYILSELPKMINSGESILIGQKLGEKAKIEIFKCDIFRYFQTLCYPRIPTRKGGK